MEYFEARKSQNVVSTPVHIAQECIDIANLAFMIHWALTHEIYELSEELDKAKAK